MRPRDGVCRRRAGHSDRGKDEEGVAKTFNPKNLKSEALPDGWIVTFQNTGGMGENYWVSVRREIGGKGYLCETTQTTPDQPKASVAFCKSLTKK